MIGVDLSFLLVIYSALGMTIGQQVSGVSASMVRIGDIVTLNDDNFAARLSDVDLALVKFFAPGCGHCERLAPEFEKAATQLKYSHPKIVLADVNCKGDGTTACSHNRIEGYPVLRIFKRGTAGSDYEGPRDSDSIVEFMKSKAGPSSSELKTVDEMKVFLDHPELVMIGFFDGEDSEMSKTFTELSDAFSDRIRFGYTFSEQVCSKYSHKNAIVLYREPRFRSKMEPTEIKYDGEATIGNLKEWTAANVHGLVGHRTLKNAEDFKNPLVIVYYDVDYTRNLKGTNYWRNRIVKVAGRFSDAGKNVSFAISNSDEFKMELKGFGLVTEKLPVVAARNALDKKFRMVEEFSVEALERFVEDFLEGKLKPFVRSAPIPESNDEPVKVVVGETFDAIVNDVTKDVLIEFYSPMCGHCMVLAPKYDKLALRLKEEGETDLVIAKIDATANEFPELYDIEGFPSIYFVKKGSKDSPLFYGGEREVDDFFRFLAKESTLPLKGYRRNGNPVKNKNKTTTTTVQGHEKEL